MLGGGIEAKSLRPVIGHWGGNRDKTLGFIADFNSFDEKQF